MEVQQQIQALLQTSDPAKAQRYHQEVGLNLLLSAHCSWTLTEGMPCTYRLPRHTLEMQWKCAPLLNPWARACLLERRAQVILLASTLRHGSLASFWVPQGISATVLQAFQAGLILWREPPLVAGQDTENRGLCWVCSHCFKFLGSIEMQIAWRLVCQQAGGEPVCTLPALTLPKLLCPRQEGLLMCAAPEALTLCT